MLDLGASQTARMSFVLWNSHLLFLKRVLLIFTQMIQKGSLQMIRVNTIQSLLYPVAIKLLDSDRKWNVLHLMSTVLGQVAVDLIFLVGHWDPFSCSFSGQWLGSFLKLMFCLVGMGWNHPEPLFLVVCLSEVGSGRLEAYLKQAKVSKWSHQWAMRSQMDFFGWLEGYPLVPSTSLYLDMGTRFCIFPF